MKNLTFAVPSSSIRIFLAINALEWKYINMKRGDSYDKKSRKYWEHIPVHFTPSKKKNTLFYLRIFINSSQGYITSDTIRNVSKHFLFSKISFAYRTISTLSFLNDQFKDSIVFVRRILLRVQ